MRRPALFSPLSLLFATISAVASSLGETSAKLSSPSTIEAIVKDSTFKYHTGRETAAVSSEGSGLNVSLLSPAQAPAVNREDISQGASPSKSVDYEIYTVDGEPIIVPQDKSRLNYSDTWAIPAAVVLLLLISAGVGLVVVYRRRTAARYCGLNEAELGEVHRS